jgi:hypothetical protein
LDQLIRDEFKKAALYTVEKITEINDIFTALWDENSRREVRMFGYGNNCGFYSIFIVAN